MATSYPNLTGNFITSEQSPSPDDVVEGYAVIVNVTGNLALSDFREDPENLLSSVELDTSVEPPVLRLYQANATSIIGRTNPVNGEFVPSQQRHRLGVRLVSGTYAGPNSALDVV